MQVLECKHIFGTSLGYTAFILSDFAFVMNHISFPQIISEKNYRAYKKIMSTRPYKSTSLGTTMVHMLKT